MNILERIKLIRPQLNAELSANQDVRHAGDILSGINPEGSWLTGRSQFDPRSQLSPIQAQGSWAFTSPKSPGTYTNDIVAKARKRSLARMHLSKPAWWAPSTLQFECTLLII